MHIIIPARFGATRLPGKPLRDVGGRPLIARVCERARASGAGRVVVATDDERIVAAVAAHGGEAILTGEQASGTDRVAEAARILGLGDEEIIVNLQGDEPLMPPALLAQVGARLADDEAASMATAAHPLHDDTAFASPHVVKVVCDSAGRALYFSRAPIPWPRSRADAAALRHIGLYAYRVGFLRRFRAWGPSPLERCEGLEQLRALEHGARIAVVVTPLDPGPGIDTEEDLARLRGLWEAGVPSS